MRQLGDLAVWLGLIMLAVGVVYYTPKVAEYMTTEPRSKITAPPPRRSGDDRHTMFRPPHHLGDSGLTR